MRLALFRRLMQQTLAIYLSETPFFGIDDAVLPLDPGSYRSDTGGGVLRFDEAGRRYRLSGGAAWPDTVTLVPVITNQDLYVFQQSDGERTSFYGALRLTLDAPGFTLFSPEGARAAALDAATGNGATPTETGYRFTGRDQLLAALVPVAAEAPASAWDRYRLI